MHVGNIGPRCRQMTRGNMFCILSTIIVLVFRGIVIVLLVDITIRYCGFCSNRILLYFSMCASHKRDISSFLDNLIVQTM